MNAPDAFVFAGGRSTRMGADKATLELDGRSFLDRIVSAVRPVSHSVTLVGREPGTGDLPAIPDLRPGLGPLAGIETALSACETDRALVVACDLPFVSTDLIRLLLDRNIVGGDGAVVPLDADGNVSPLCAVYPRSSLALVSELLDRGERTPRSLLVRIPTDLVPFDDYAGLDGAPWLLRNINTPSDLADAIRAAEKAPEQ